MGSLSLIATSSTGSTNERDAALAELLSRWHALLQAWAKDDSLASAIKQALHLDSNENRLGDLLKNLAEGNTTQLPSIQLLGSDRINGALGAYAASTATIYLNRQWLEQASSDQAITVLNEELGHHLDALGNSEDTIGDEGKHFAALLAGHDFKASAYTTDSKGTIIDQSGQEIEAEFAIEIVTPSQQPAQDAEYGYLTFSFSNPQYNAIMSIAPTPISGSINNDPFPGSYTNQPYYYGTRLYRGNPTSTSDRLTMNFDRSLATLHTSPSGLPVWQIFTDVARTQYITAFMPYVEEIFFAGGGGSVVRQESSPFPKDVVFSYLQGGVAFNDTAPYAGFEGAGAKDFFFGRPWNPNDQSTKPAADPFILRGGPEEDTLFLPYRKSDSAFDYIEEIGISRIAPPTSKSGNSSGLNTTGAKYITFSTETYEFLDGIFKCSGLTDYNIVNGAPYEQATGIVSATNILGLYEGQTPVGTGGNDFIIADNRFDTNVYNGFDGLSGTDILYLPRYNSSDVVLFENPGPSSHRILVGSRTISLSNIEYILFADKAWAISADSDQRRVIEWQTDSGYTPKTYNLTGDSSVAEGATYQAELQATGVPNGTIFYWKIAHGTTNADDFEPGNTQGTATLQSGLADITVQVKADASTEGSQTATLEVYTDSNFTNRVALKNFTINDTSTTASYSISAPSSVNEGGTFTATLNSSNSTGNQVVYWKVINGTTASADFSSPIQGSTTLTQGSAQASIDIAADQTTEGSQSATIKFFSDASFTSEIASKQFTINDTSTSSGGSTGGGTGGGGSGGGTGTDLDQLEGDFSDPFDAELVGWTTTAKLGSYLQHPVSEGDSVTATIALKGVSEGEQVMYSWVYSDFSDNEAERADFERASSGVATVNSLGRIRVSNYLSRDEATEGTELAALYVSGNSRKKWGWFYDIRDTSRNTNVLDSYTAVDSLSSRYTGLRLLGKLSVIGTGNNLNNIINGNIGNNRLIGRGGRDTLEGGLGKDRLTGGTQADRYLLRRAGHSLPGSSRRDVITDFRRSEGDRIDLARIDANSRASGNQAFRWIGGKSFTGIPGQLRYSNGIVAGDLNGDKKTDFEIQLIGSPSLSAAQIIL